MGRLFDHDVASPSRPKSSGKARKKAEVELELASGAPRAIWAYLLEHGADAHKLAALLRERLPPAERRRAYLELVRDLGLDRAASVWQLALVEPQLERPVVPSLVTRELAEAAEGRSLVDIHVMTGELIDVLAEQLDPVARHRARAQLAVQAAHGRAPRWQPPPESAATKPGTPAEDEGRPLPEGVRGEMERALGVSLDGVRVHEGPEAQAKGAVAFARGRDVHFAEGRFRPDTREGKHLLAHELAHVAQAAKDGGAATGNGAAATGNGAAATRNGAPASRAAEREAERAAQAITEGGRAPALRERLSGEAHADEAAAEPAAPFEIQLFGRTLHAKLGETVDLPNGLKRVSVLESKLGPVVIDELDLELDGTRVVRGVLKAGLDDGRFQGSHGHVEVDEHGQVTGALDLLVDLPGTLAKHVSVELTPDRLAATIQLESGDFVFHELPVLAPNMSIDVGESATGGLEVSLRGETTVRLPLGFVESTGVLSAKITTGGKPGADVTVVAGLEVPGLGARAEATLRYDGKKIVLEGAAAEVPLKVPGVKGTAQVSWAPGGKLAVAVPDLTFTAPGLDKLKVEDFSLAEGKLAGRVVVRDGEVIDLGGLKATLHESGLAFDGAQLTGRLGGELEIAGGASGTFSLAYGEDGLEGDLELGGQKFSLGPGKATIEAGSQLHVDKRGLDGVVKATVALGPLKKVDVTLTPIPGGPFGISAKTAVRLDALVPSLDGELSVGYDGSIRSGTFSVTVDQPMVKELPESKFLDRLELQLGPSGLAGSLTPIPGARISYKGTSLTVAGGFVGFAGGVLDGEIKGKIEAGGTGESGAAGASADVAVGWKHGKFSWEAEGEVELATVTSGAVLGKVHGKAGSGEGADLELVEPARFAAKQLEGVHIVTLKGNTQSKHFTVGIEASSFINNLARGVKSVELQLDQAAAQVSVDGKGKLEAAGGLSGAAAFKPGGKEVASGTFHAKLDEEGFGGEIAVEKFTAPGLSGHGLVIDLKEGVTAGSLFFKVPNVVDAKIENLVARPRTGEFGFDAKVKFAENLKALHKVDIEAKLENGQFTAAARLVENVELEGMAGAHLKVNAGESQARYDAGKFGVHLHGEAGLPGGLAQGTFDLTLEGKQLSGGVHATTRPVAAFKEGTQVDLTYAHGRLDGEAKLELGAPFDQYFSSTTAKLEVHGKQFSVEGKILGPIRGLGEIGETFQGAEVSFRSATQQLEAHSDLNVGKLPTFGAGSHLAFDFLEGKPQIHGTLKVGNLPIKLTENAVEIDWVAKQGIHVHGGVSAEVDGIGTVAVKTDTRTDEGRFAFRLEGEITASALAAKYPGVQFGQVPRALVSISNESGKWDYGVEDLSAHIVGLEGVDECDLVLAAHYTRSQGIGGLAAIKKLKVKNFDFSGSLAVEKGKFAGGALGVQADFPGVGLGGSVTVTPGEMAKPNFHAELFAAPKGGGAISKFVKSGSMSVDFHGGKLQKADGQVELSPPDFLQMKEAVVGISYSEAEGVVGRLHTELTVPLGDGITGELDVTVGGREKFLLELSFPFTLPGFEEARIGGSINAHGDVKIFGRFVPKGLPFLKMAEIGIGYKNGNFDIYGFVILTPTPELELKVGVHYDVGKRELVVDGLEPIEKENPAPPEPPLHKDLFNKKIPLFGVGVLNVALSLRFGVGLAIAKPKLKLDKPEIVGGLSAMDKGEMPEIKFGGDVGIGVDLTMEFGVGIAGQIQLLIAEADVGIEGVAKAVLNLMVGSKIQGSFKQGQGATMTIDPYVAATLKLIAELNAFFYAEVCWFTIIDKKWPLAGAELATIPLGELHPFKPLTLNVGGPEGTKLSTPEIGIEPDEIVDGVQKGANDLSNDQANEDARNKLRPVLQSMKAAAPQFEELPPDWREGMTVAPVSFDEMFPMPEKSWDFYREHADDAETIDKADAMRTPTERLAKAVAVLSRRNPYLAGMLVLEWRRAQIAHMGVNPDTGVDVVAEQKEVQALQDLWFAQQLAEAEAKQKAQDTQHTQAVTKQGQDFAHAERDHAKKDEQTRAEFGQHTHALDEERKGAQARVEAASKEADKAGVRERPAVGVKAPDKPAPPPPVALPKLQKPAAIPTPPPVPVPQAPPQVPQVTLPELPRDPGVSPPATRPIPAAAKPAPPVNVPAPAPQPGTPPASVPTASSSATPKGGGGGRPIGDGKPAQKPAAAGGGGGAPVPGPRVQAGPAGIISQAKTLDQKKADLQKKTGQGGGAGGGGAGAGAGAPAGGAGGAAGAVVGAAGAIAAATGGKAGKGAAPTAPAGEHAAGKGAAPVDPTVQKTIDAGKLQEEKQKKDAQAKEQGFQKQVSQSTHAASDAEAQLSEATKKKHDEDAAGAAGGGPAGAGAAGAGAAGAGVAGAGAAIAAPVARNGIPSTREAGGGPGRGAGATPPQRFRANIADFAMPTPNEARVMYSNWLKVGQRGLTWLGFQEKLAMRQYFDFEKRSFHSAITEYEILVENKKPNELLPEAKMFCSKMYGGYIWAGGTFRLAAGFDPSYSLSDETLKALSTLERFKASYRGNPAGEYLAHEAEKLADAAKTAFVSLYLEPIAGALDALRALRAAIYRLGPQVEVQQKLAMVDAGKGVDGPAFWTVLGQKFRGTGTGLEQVNEALATLEHALEAAGPPPGASAAPATGGALKPAPVAKPVEQKANPPTLRHWAEVAAQFEALKADRALEQLLGAFGVHAGAPLAVNQQTMLAQKRKELEALAKAMPGKRPDEVHEAWRKSAHGQAVEHNRVVLEVARKYALLTRELRAKEPRLDGDGVAHAVAAFRQRVGSNGLVYAVPGLNPPGAKPEEQVDPALPLKPVGGADWNPLLDRAWMGSTFEAMDPAAAQAAPGVAATPAVIVAGSAVGAPASATAAGVIAPKPSAVSKHAAGRPDSDWQSRVAASLPSERVVTDDPGHTYHVLKDGKAVATSDAMNLDPPTTQAARTVAGVITQKDAPQKDAPASNIPPGVMDPAVIEKQGGSFIVGRHLERAAEGHSILSQLSQGNPTALKPVGVGMLQFVVNSVEWGLGEWHPKTPPAAVASAPFTPVFRIVKGEGQSVDWSHVPELKAIGHAHPARPLDPLAKAKVGNKQGTGSMKFEDLIAIDRNRAKIAPSASDFHYVYTKGIERHVVHTPYQMDPKTREVFNPSEIRGVTADVAPPLTFVIHRSMMAPVEGMHFYRGTLIAMAGSTEVWRGGFECWKEDSPEVCFMLPNPIPVAPPPPANSSSGSGSTQAGQVGKVTDRSAAPPGTAPAPSNGGTSDATKQPEVDLPRLLVAQGVPTIAKAKPALINAVRGAKDGETIYESGASDPKTTVKKMLSEHPDAHLDSAKGELVLPPVDEIALEKASSLKDVGAAVAARTGVSRVFIKFSREAIEIEGQVNPYTTVGRFTFKDISPDAGQKVLLLGEGNFSFAQSLAKNLPNKGKGVVATSFDSGAEVRSKYKGASDNIAQSEANGALVVHGVDAQKIDPNLGGPPPEFQYIVFNFPFVPGPRTTAVPRNRQMLRAFLESANSALAPGGKVYVTSKDYWLSRFDLEESAASVGLKWENPKAFKADEFPDYEHRMSHDDSSAKKTDDVVTIVFTKG